MNTVLKERPTTAGPGSPRPFGLAAWAYGHAELTRLEFERILRPSWQIVCHASALARPGDYATLDMGPDSIVVLRDRDGAVRAFHNVCRHRGTRMLDGAGHCPGTLVCPYHGWSYRYDGSLLATPARDSLPGLDLREYGLKPVRTDTLLGFVFVCVAGDPPSPAKQWGALLEELAPYRVEDMVPLAPPYTEEWAVDWKIAMDNYLESYHVPIGHPGLNRMFTPDYEDQRAVPGIARGISWLREQPSSRWSERIYQKHVARLTAHLPEPNRRSWRFYSCLPNLGIDVMPEQMDFFQVLPAGPGRTRIRGQSFGLPDTRRELRLLRWLGNRINVQVNAEDRWLCERLQRGIASSSYEPGPLSQLECWMYEFHDLLRARIPEIALPVPPQRFAPAG